MKRSLTTLVSMLGVLTFTAEPIHADPVIVVSITSSLGKVKIMSRIATDLLGAVLVAIIACCSASSACADPVTATAGNSFSTILTFTNTGSGPATAFFSVNSTATLSVPAGSGTASSAATLSVVGGSTLFSFSSPSPGGPPVSFGGTFFFPLAVGESITLAYVGMTHADATATIAGPFFSRAVVNIADNTTFGNSGSTGVIILTISGGSSYMLDVIGENPPVETGMASLATMSEGSSFADSTTDVPRSAVIDIPTSPSFSITAGTSFTFSGSLEVAAEAAAVPEPSSMVLLGSGLVSLLGYGWRRRKQNVGSDSQMETLGDDELNRPE